ncbi:hypothetical protein JTE90_009016 [Oedothorax gibbosus]|uniref:Uncharacterized protein n=1 Tax=Oedothorax gibbosus TaxID=931172 RepID=A0AAV6VK39_9ARAC|nr:hypothetical protein JTE90_009016 [Oedothorax gibbosus]
MSFDFEQRQQARIRRYQKHTVASTFRECGFFEFRLKNYLWSWNILESQSYSNFGAEDFYNTDLVKKSEGLFFRLTKVGTMTFEQRQQARIRRYQEAHRGLNFLRVWLPPTTDRRVNVIGLNGRVFRGQIPAVPLDRLPTGVEVVGEQELYEEIRDMKFPEVPEQEPLGPGRRIGGAHTKSNKQLSFAPAIVNDTEENQKTRVSLLGADGHVYRGTGKPESVIEPDRKLQGSRKSRSAKEIREAVVPTVVSLYINGRPLYDDERTDRIEETSVTLIEMPVPHLERMVEVARQKEIRAQIEKHRLPREDSEEDTSDDSSAHSDEEQASNIKDSKEETTGSSKNSVEQGPDLQDSKEVSSDDSSAHSDEEQASNMQDSKEETSGSSENSVEQGPDLQDSKEVSSDLSQSSEEEESVSQESGYESGSESSEELATSSDSKESSDQDSKDILDSEKVSASQKAKDVMGSQDSGGHESDQENVSKDHNNELEVQVGSKDSTDAQDSEQNSSSQNPENVTNIHESDQENDSYNSHDESEDNHDAHNSDLTSSQNPDNVTDVHESDQENASHDSHKESPDFKDSKNTTDVRDLNVTSGQNQGTVPGSKDTGFQKSDQEYASHKDIKQSPDSHNSKDIPNSED